MECQKKIRKDSNERVRFVKAYSPVKKRSKISEEYMKSPLQIKRTETKKNGRRFSKKDISSFHVGVISPIKYVKTKK